MPYSKAKYTQMSVTIGSAVLSQHILECSVTKIQTREEIAQWPSEGESKSRDSFAERHFGRRLALFDQMPSR